VALLELTLLVVEPSVLPPGHPVVRRENDERLGQTRPEGREDRRHLPVHLPEGLQRVADAGVSLRQGGVTENRQGAIPGRLVGDVRLLERRGPPGRHVVERVSVREVRSEGKVRGPRCVVQVEGVPCGTPSTNSTAYEPKRAVS
jgi:hypothetical protein